MSTIPSTMAGKDTLEAFIQSLDKLASPEEKLKNAIQFMRNCITSQEKSPDFRGFWEVRKTVLPLFKEVAATPRKDLWAEFVELTRDGRRLKDLIDEESAFAIEQIEIAIGALTADIEGFHQNDEAVLSKSPEVFFPMASKVLEERRDCYLSTQHRLNLLNAFASQINSLRKEIMGTSMRAKSKNRLFEELSQLGDKVFPLRRQYILEISNAFIEDVEEFVESNFSEAHFSYDRVKRKVFFYREEIKALQAIAKVLSLNTEAFTKTREELSKCWDKLKGMEKELKKEFAEQKLKSNENTVEVQAKIKEVEEQFQAGAMNLMAAEEALREISRWMREIDLTHTDVKALKEEIAQVDALLDVKRQEEENERRKRDEEQERKRQEELDKLKAKISVLRDKIADEKVDQLEIQLKALREEIATLSLTKWAKQLIEKELKEIREAIEEKKEKLILALPDDEKEALQNLMALLQQKKQKRQEIKSQIEEYRKIIGGSSLDFEKGIEMNSLMSEEKARLEKVDEAISEIERKISEFKNKRG